MWRPGPRSVRHRASTKFDLREETRRFPGRAIAAVIGSNRKNYNPTPCPSWEATIGPHITLTLAVGFSEATIPACRFCTFPVKFVRSLRELRVARSVGVLMAWHVSKGV